MHTYKQLTYIVIFTLLFFGAVSVQAQTEVRVDSNQQTEVRASSDVDDRCGPDEVCPRDTDSDADSLETERCDDGVCTEAEEAAGANYNNSRSNRSTVVDTDADGRADVRVGERCEDGVCTEVEMAESASRNPQTGKEITIPARGTDVTGEIILGEDRDMVMPGDNKSNDSVQTGAAAADAQDYNSSRSNKPDTESDLDDNDNTDRANYNNSRSNRATIVGGGNDGPLDQVRKGTIKRLDKASPKLITTLGIDNDSPIKDDGVELYVRGDVCGANDEDCDDDGVPTSPSARDLTLHVSGERVRGWNPDQKAEVSRRLQAAGTSTTANDFGLRVAQAAINNDNVADIASNNQDTEVSFRTRMRLLGFIPTQANATAQADAAGEVTVDYPWYSFLASKGDSSIFSSLASELRAAHDVMVSPVNDPPQASDE